MNSGNSKIICALLFIKEGSAVDDYYFSNSKCKMCSCVTSAGNERLQFVAVKRVAQNQQA